jgi:hypothetical protein
LSKSTFTVERHKKVLTQVKKSDVITPKTGKIKNQHYAKVSFCQKAVKYYAAKTIATQSLDTESISSLNPRFCGDDKVGTRITASFWWEGVHKCWLF